MSPSLVLRSKLAVLELCDRSEVSVLTCSFLSWIPGKDGVDLDAGTAASAEFGDEVHLQGLALFCPEGPTPK